MIWKKMEVDVLDMKEDLTELKRTKSQKQQEEEKRKAYIVPEKRGKERKVRKKKKRKKESRIKIRVLMREKWEVRRMQVELVHQHNIPR